MTYEKSEITIGYNTYETHQHTSGLSIVKISGSNYGIAHTALKLFAIPRGSGLKTLVEARRAIEFLTPEGMNWDSDDDSEIVRRMNENNVGATGIAAFLRDIEESRTEAAKERKAKRDADTPKLCDVEIPTGEKFVQKRVKYNYRYTDKDTEKIAVAHLHPSGLCLLKTWKNYYKIYHITSSTAVAYWSFEGLDKAKEALEIFLSLLPLDFTQDWDEVVEASGNIDEKLSKDTFYKMVGMSSS